MEEHILVTQGNLALTYAALGHLEKALSMERDVYSGFLKLHGEEDERTLHTVYQSPLSRDVGTSISLPILANTMARIAATNGVSPRHQAVPVPA